MFDNARGTTCSEDKTNRITCIDASAMPCYTCKRIQEKLERSVSGSGLG